MIKRPFWIKAVEAAWRKRSIVWLAGVRRVGKTTLAGMLDDVLYFNCDLPSTVRKLEDPELFLNALPPRARIVLDEIHRLPDPTRVLKIAADSYGGLKILATGSSTLAASGKFRDSLTGRKVALTLLPVLWSESPEPFGINDFDRRLLHGGLPEPLLSERKDPAFFSEWMDSFYARDILELFGVRERTAFLNLLQFMLYYSGNQVEITTLSRECGISRPTVKAYLEAMTIACALYPVPPFHGGGRREIIRQPKLYAFDTGFVTFARGWDFIREEDRGGLWEHLVLDGLRGVIQGVIRIHYWRDKQGNEVDFILPLSRDRVDAIECKVNPDKFHPRSLRIFRAYYPKGKNYLVVPHVRESYQRRYDGIVMTVTPLSALQKAFHFIL